MIIQITINDKKQAQQEVQKLNSVYKKGIWFIWYYADWCGHCKSMEQDWNTFIKKVPKEFNVAKVESNFIPKLSYKPQVQGFPTLRLYDKGVERYDYEGERNSDKFVEFLNNFKKSPDSFQNNVPKYEAPVQPLEPNQPTGLNESKLNQLFEIVSNQAKENIAPNFNPQALLSRHTKRKTEPKSSEKFNLIKLGDVGSQIAELKNRITKQKTRMPSHASVHASVRATKKTSEVVDRSSKRKQDKMEGDRPPFTPKKKKNRNRNKQREAV